MNIELLLSIIGACTGIFGAVCGFFGIIHNRFLAVNEYLTALEDSEFVEARKQIYNQEEKLSPDDVQASVVVNFFHHWGLMARKHYLPLWVFDSGSGAGVIRLYSLTEQYIEERRQLHNDPTYASNFEWLNRAMKRREGRWYV